MTERRDRWNERHARGEETHDYRPSPPLASAVRDEPPGVALDLACGSGRHALYLAERGFHVVAVDWSQTGIDALMAEARKRGVDENIEPVVADLEAGEFKLDPGRFDLVIDFYFLDRALLPAIRDSVVPGGLFVAAIHVQSPQDAASHSFLLEPGELHRVVSGWGFDILHSNDGAAATNGHAHATSEIVARRR
jgi:SAM-dependent methyltransferase